LNFLSLIVVRPPLTVLRVHPSVDAGGAATVWRRCSRGSLMELGIPEQVHGLVFEVAVEPELIVEVGIGIPAYRAVRVG
jgi:hypothetical protein